MVLQMKFVFRAILFSVLFMSAKSVFALEGWVAANVNWVGISRSGGYKIQAELEKNGELRVYYLDLDSDGSMSDFAKTVYSTLMTAKVSGQKVQIASDNGQTYIKYVYLKEN